MKPCVYINKPCVFCAYASKQIEREFVYEDDQVVAFYSKSPVALKHLLVVPRAHIGTCCEENETLKTASETLTGPMSHSTNDQNVQKKLLFKFIAS